MNQISPSKVNFIKLGRKGIWEHECIEQANTLRLGFSTADHSLCKAGKWDEIRQHFLDNENKTSSVATNYRNQIKEFYDAEANVLWITFYQQRLWWCFSEPIVTLLADKTKTRPVTGKWSCEDVNGKPLDADRLSGKLLCVQGFQGTICKIIESEYAVRKINGLELPATTDAKNALLQLSNTMKALIKELRPQDFEVFVDLIFRQAGWLRTGEVGQTTKDIDIDLFSPVLGHRAFVQIKSASEVAEFQEYCDTFEKMLQFQQMFYVVHTPNEALSQIIVSNDRIKLLLLDDIAKLAISGGLVDWLIEKTS